MTHYYSRNLINYFRYGTLLFILFITLQVQSQPAGNPRINFAPFIQGLSAPLDLVNAGDGTGRLFIVQRGGAIRIYDGGLIATPFIDLKDTVLNNGEQGLLSMAFHPDYETNGYFFVYYTDKEGDVTLARYQRSSNPLIADPNSEVILLELPKPGNPYFSNHNGGKIAFGTDGYLYVSIGDGGNGGDPFNNAQNGNSLFGKMLRLNVNNFATPPYYSIPPGNPYSSDPNVRDEIWALGLRNPWRWSFDRLTGDMWIADVGQGAWEEINYRAVGTTGGINYGWRCYEGTNPYNTSGCAGASSYISPIFQYPHNSATGGFSVTGGNVYRGPGFPFLNGWYIVADYISGNVWKIYPDGSGGWNVFQQSGLPGNIAGFGEAEDGTLYAVSLGGGNVYRVESIALVPVKLKLFKGSWQERDAVVSWQTEFEENVNRFDIQYSTTGTEFSNIGSVNASNNSTGNMYTFTHTPIEAGKHFYRLAMIDNDGTIEYSRIINLNNSDILETRVFPTVVENGIINIETNEPLQSIQIISMLGRVELKQVLNGQSGKFNLQVGQLQAGNYVLHLMAEGTLITRKFVIK